MVVKIGRILCDEQRPRKLYLCDRRSGETSLSRRFKVTRRSVNLLKSDAALRSILNTQSPRYFGAGQFLAALYPAASASLTLPNLA
jgi:hypothetical protein